MKVCIPYIYKVTFKPENKVYIGSKSNKAGSNPETFWKPKGYFTSSLVVKSLIEEHGISEDIWDIEILQIFDQAEIKTVRHIENDLIVALVEEIGVDNVLNKKWVVNGRVHSNTGIQHTEETIKKLKEFAKDKVSAYDKDGKKVRITKEEFDKGGYTGINTGKSFYHNPLTLECISLAKGEPIPEGFVKGIYRANKPTGVKAGETRWITDGVQNKKLNIGDELPEGWRIGRSGIKGTTWTEERTEKFKNAFANKPKKEKPAKRPKGEAQKGVKHSEERIQANREAQLRANEERMNSGKEHPNKGRKKSPEEMARRSETRKRSSLTKERHLEGY